MDEIIQQANSLKQLDSCQKLKEFNEIRGKEELWEYFEK